MDLIKYLAKHLAGLLALVASCSAMGVPLLSEGFDNVATLPARGWAFVNSSSPPGTTGWFQGNAAIFPAASGPANAYIAANFNSAGFGGAVSNWLLTPEVMLTNGESLDFSLRLLGEGLLDRMEVYVSTGGAFSMLAAFESDSDTGWLDKTILVNGLAAPAIGRYAFRYVVDDTSINGNYVGIDTVSVNALPVPDTVALLCLGLVVLLGTGRSRRRWLAATGLAASALVANADEHGVMSFPHVQVTRQQVPATAAAAAADPGQGGFMAYKDPQTGQLTGPNPAQAALLTAAARTPAPLVRQRPQLIRPPYGGIGVMLDERQARYAMVRKADDGSLTETCVPAEGETK
ncbi:hypothetical protein GTP58_09320 [Duganella sp. CY15W]|uniref:choice-of-anchor J domain-containing protein n=1 Tax=Duganella sp. CY15W TaxID=2692172 RepID=UPI001368FB0B|nr:choice-of-anchor J domain-containing protein [Duganella sp. CY15W]MYM28521.1 hypothetical protein [Duganella sp. CY15W]